MKKFIRDKTKNMGYFQEQDDKRDGRNDFEQGRRPDHDRYDDRWNQNYYRESYDEARREEERRQERRQEERQQEEREERARQERRQWQDQIEEREYHGMQQYPDYQEPEPQDEGIAQCMQMIHSLYPNAFHWLADSSTGMNVITSNRENGIELGVGGSELQAWQAAIEFCKNETSEEPKQESNNDLL